MSDVQCIMTGGQKASQPETTGSDLVKPQKHRRMRAPWETRCASRMHRSVRCEAALLASTSSQPSSSAAPPSRATNTGSCKRKSIVKALFSDVMFQNSRRSAPRCSPPKPQTRAPAMKGGWQQTSMLSSELGFRMFHNCSCRPLQRHPPASPKPAPEVGCFED